MHPIRASRRPAWIVPWLGSVVLVSLAAALAASRPRPPGWNKHPPVPASARPALRFPPGWNKHPPLPAHAHTLATSGFPGWQLTLMAATVALLATAAAIGYLGPGCTADARTLRPSGDRIRRRFDQRGQLRRQRPHRASRPSRTGFAGRFLPDVTAATSVATSQHGPTPATVMPRRRVMTALRLAPRTIQLCIHCHQNPAGFWGSRTSDQTVRRPCCLACCQWLDPGRYQVIPFDGHGDTGRLR